MPDKNPRVVINLIRADFTPCDVIILPVTSSFCSARLLPPAASLRTMCESSSSPISRRWTATSQRSVSTNRAHTRSYEVIRGHMRLCAGMCSSGDVSKLRDSRAVMLLVVWFGLRGNAVSKSSGCLVVSQGYPYSVTFAVYFS